MSAAADDSRQETGEDRSAATRAPRWRRDRGSVTTGRTKAFVLASCLLATCLGVLVALVTLPATKPDTVLVSLYLAPPSMQCTGVDAPHPPLLHPLFGLTVSNTAAVPDVETEPPRNAAIDTKKRFTDWRAAVAKCDRKKQVVLHVSSLARVDNGQVFFFGLDAAERTETTVPLTDVIENLNRCNATSKLLVLEVQWPMVSDQGDPSSRLTEMETAIKHQLRQFGDSDCHVLLASSGQTACRGLTDQPATLLGHFLTTALQSGNADSDHNGRTTIEETVNWAAPRVAAHSAANQHSQQIDWIAGASPFAFTELPSSPQPVQRVYPVWLADAWHRRQAYIKDPRLPWDSAAAVRWGQLLIAIESDWRRGETDKDLQVRLGQQEPAVVEVIEQALAQRCNARPDSLRLAALRVVGKQNRDDDQLAATLLAQHEDILQNAPADKRQVEIAKAVTQYVSHYDADEAAVAMAALLRMFDNKALNDIESLSLVSQVNQACKPPVSYPVLDAVDRLVAMDAHPLRVQAIVQIFRLQEQLGTDPLATAILGDVIDNAMQQLIFAQRLVWNPGLTDREQVRQHVEVAVNAAAMALIAEQSLGQAIRQVQRIDATVSTDVLSGVFWKESEHFHAVEQHSQKLMQAINRMQATSQRTGIFTPGELAMVRQASEALQREWLQFTNLKHAALQASITVPHEPLTTSLPAADRVQLLTRTQSDRLPRADVQTVFYRPADADATSVQGMTTERLRAAPLQSRLGGLSKGTANRYHAWCQNFLASSSQIEAIPSYRRIAKMHSIAGNANVLPVLISGGLQGLNWNQPTGRIDLRYAVDLADAAPVQYKILTPAADSLQVLPRQGILRPGGQCTIEIQLVRRDTPAENVTAENVTAENTPLTGIWLCLQRGDEHQRIPLRMEPQPATPNIDIDFGPQALQEGRNATLHLWPSSEPQWQSWYIRTHECSVKSVVATLSSSNGPTLRSAPIALTSNDTQPIRFLPNKSAGSPALQGDLTLTLADPAQGTLVGQWQIHTELKDPRQVLELGWAEFDVAVSGTNRLEVSLARSRSVSKTLGEQSHSPTVRLGLDPASQAPLLDFASSRLQTRLPNDGTPVTLYATNLRFQEGAEPLLSIPLWIDGDPGCCILEGRFPRRSGSVQLNWLRRPTLALHADAATTSTLPLDVRIAARNLNDSQALKLELFSDASSRDRPLWQTQLKTSRHADVCFDVGGKEHTVQIVAERHDWNVAVPTQFGNGPHHLRVSTMQPVGVDKVVASHSFVVDDSVPQDVAIRAVQSSQQTNLTITMRPGPAGIRRLSVAAVQATTDKPGKPLEATAVDESGRRWKLRWPQGLALPEQMLVTLQTGAGKTCTVTRDLQTQTLPPVGVLWGTVLEGTRAQPGLTVEVAKPHGRSFARVRTDQAGHYQFSLAPGKYVVRTEKSATGRHAQAAVTVTEQARVTAGLRLSK